jgi:hypothetical protein
MPLPLHLVSPDSWRKTAVKMKKRRGETYFRNSGIICPLSYSISRMATSFSF